MSIQRRIRRLETQSETRAVLGREDRPTVYYGDEEIHWKTALRRYDDLIAGRINLVPLPGSQAEKEAMVTEAQLEGSVMTVGRMRQIGGFTEVEISNAAEQTIVDEIERRARTPDELAELMEIHRTRRDSALG